MGQRHSRRQQGSGQPVIMMYVNDASASAGTSRQRSASSNAHKSSGKKRTTSSKTTSSEPNVKASGQQQQRYHRSSLTTAATASSSMYNNNNNNNNNNGHQQLHQQRPNIASSSRHHQNHVTTSTSLNRATNYDVTDYAAAVIRAPSPPSSQSNTMKLLNLRGVSATDRQAYILHQSKNSRTMGKSGYKTFIAQPVMQAELVGVDSGRADKSDASPTYNGSKPRLHKQNSLPVGASAMDYYDNEQQRQQQQQQQQLDENRQLYWPSDEQRRSSSNRHRQDAAAAAVGATASTTPSQLRRRPADQHEVSVTQYQSDYDVNRRPNHEVAVMVTKEYEDVTLPKSAAHRANRDVRASYQSDTDDVFRGNETTSRTYRAERDPTLTKHRHHHQLASRDDSTLSKHIRSRDMRDKYQSDSEVVSRRRQDDFNNVDRRTTGHSHSSRTDSVNRHLTNGQHDEAAAVAAAAARRSAPLQPDVTRDAGMIDFPAEDETGQDVMMNGAGASDGAYQHNAEKSERKYKSLTLLPQDRDDRSHSYQHQQPSPSSHSETLEKRRAATHYATVEQQHSKATRGNASSISSQPSPSSGFFSMSDATVQSGQGQGLLATIDEVDASGGAGSSHRARTSRQPQPLTLVTSSVDESDVTMARSPRQPSTSTSSVAQPPSSRLVARAVVGDGGSTLQRMPQQLNHHQNPTMQRFYAEQGQIHRPSSMDGRYHTQSPELQRRQQGQGSRSNPSSSAPRLVATSSLTNLAVTPPPDLDTVDSGSELHAIAKPAPHPFGAVSNRRPPSTKPALLVVAPDSTARITAPSPRGSGSRLPSASRERGREVLMPVAAPVTAAPVLFATKPQSASTMTRQHPRYQQQQQQQQQPHPSSATMARRTASYRSQQDGRQRVGSDNLSLHSSIPYL